MNPAARQALQTIASRARQVEALDTERLAAALRGVDLPPSLDQLADALAACRVTLNFHPDRLLEDRSSVAQGLLSTGHYLSQGQTGVSNGMRFAVAGSKRLEWERELFGAAYDDHQTAGRPVYGSLDLTQDPFGGSPRFGSSFVVLEPHCLQRTTLCVGDSHVGPTDIGTIDTATSILAGLFECAGAGVALNRGLDTRDLVKTLIDRPSLDIPARDLDGYIEAQVHGGVSLANDVSEIVLDPSFVGSEAGVHLEAASRKFDFRLSWHQGSELAVDAVPADFRGPTMPALAATVAGDSTAFDAAAIGRSAANFMYTPPLVTGDPDDSPLQQHKRLWHCLLRFGRPASSPVAQ